MAAPTNLADAAPHGSLPLGAFPGGRLGWWACIALVVALTATRYRACWFSYSFDGYADEPAVIDPALAAANGDLRPQEFLYPGWTSYSIALVYRLAHAFGAGGDWLSPTPGPDHFVAGRLVVFAVCLATLVVTALAARKLFGPWAGVAAAALCACSPLYTSLSVIATVNPPASLWTVATVYFSARLYVDGRRTRDYLLAGVCAGFAVGSKYNSYSAVLAITAAHFLAPGALAELRGASARAWLGAFQPLVVSGLVAVVAFFATTPYALIEPQRFASDLKLLSDIYQRHWPLHTNPSGRTWSNYVERMWAFGWPREMFVAACVGLLVTLVKDARRSVIAGVAVLFNFAFLGLYAVYFLRHFLPAVPAFALLSGAAVQWAAERSGDWMARRARGSEQVRARRGAWVAAGLALVLIGGLGARALSLSQSRIAKATLLDSRAAAREWINENLPPGSRIVCEERSPFESFEPAFKLRVMRSIVLPDRRAEVEEWADYCLLTLAGASKLEREPTFAGSKERYDEFTSRHELVAEFLGRGVQYSGRDIRVYRIRRD